VSDELLIGLLQLSSKSYLKFLELLSKLARIGLLELGKILELPPDCRQL
jgi:hypothetical protein